MRTRTTGRTFWHGTSSCSTRYTRRREQPDRRSTRPPGPNRNRHRGTAGQTGSPTMPITRHKHIKINKPSENDLQLTRWIQAEPWTVAARAAELARRSVNATEPSPSLSVRSTHPRLRSGHQARTVRVAALAEEPRRADRPTASRRRRSLDGFARRRSPAAAQPAGDAPRRLRPPLPWRRCQSKRCRRSPRRSDG